MRESDQASLLEGAIQIARDGKVCGVNFYNYRGQYGSYWILAGVFWLLGLSDVGVASSSVIFYGNFFTASIFCSGLFLLLLRSGPQTLPEWVVTIVVLLSPTFLFSAPLLSSNLISGGFLCLTTNFFVQEKSKINLFCLAIFSFVSVASRGDACLLYTSPSPRDRG